MATAELNAVFPHLRRIVLLRDGAGMTDGQLLESFISQRDEAAFETLVRRHGPMVLNVCRRVVRNHHDAEDIFQATFLVLARKASSVKSRETVANWLHGVALRTALKARSLRAKSQLRERQVTHMPEPEAVEQDDCLDLRLLLDQELSRLAEIYRLPVLLCDLEGNSIRKTAQQLGWPQGTVAGRLARGRKMLAKRLAWHGLTMSGAVVFVQNSVSACVPPSLVASTVKAAGAYAAGQTAALGVISASVAVLMEGVVKAMFLTKLKIATVVLMVGSIVALGGGVVIYGTAAGQQIESAREGEKPAKRQAGQPKEKADAGKKDASIAKTDHEKLRGNWRVVEADYGGTETQLQDSQWSIGKDKIVMNRAMLSTKKWAEGRQDASYHFWGDNDDTAPAPNNINMTFQLIITSPDKKQHATLQQTYRGIFAWDGDRLKLCFRQLVFGKRPTEIPASSSKDDNLLIVVLKRETAIPKTDEEKLQGDWKVVGGELLGEAIDVSKGSPHMSFVGDLICSPEEQGGEIFKLDSAKSPKQITIIYRSGNVERKIVGIYSLDGDDLKICYLVDENAALPGDFTAAKGSHRQMLLLKRVKSPVAGATLSQVQRREDGNAAEPVITKKGTKKTEGDAKKIEDSLYQRLQGGYLDLKKANYEIWVKEVKGRRLIHPIFIHRDNQGRNDFLVRAEEAELKVDLAKRSLLIIMSNVIITSREGDEAVIEHRTWSLPLRSIDEVP